MEERPVEAPGSNTTIPEDSGSSEALEHQAPLPRRLRQQKGQCQRLAHLAALTQDTPGHGAPTPRSTHGRAAGAPEGSSAHLEEPPGEEPRPGSFPQPQLPESENPIRAQAWVFIPWCPACGFATLLRKRTPRSSV
ncbi:golgin subfamily A member 2-like isoform X1 [Fukomys damarensis]|uniref:golgin subfamily A member 2-like isoform X1 n=1 Tax=Fukomys damarensis TaxID=885580 RepID=UPI001455BE01|nr:golgin subfamily A member 2-like isoform X1 [Fukomys damarensis]